MTLGYIVAGVGWTVASTALFCLALHIGFRWGMTCRHCGFMVRSFTRGDAEYTAAVHRSICGPVVVERRYRRGRAS